MQGFKHRYFEAGPAIGVGAGPALGTFDRAGDRVGHTIENAPGLKYSSPWPWTLALGISLSIWAGLIWFVRLVV
jgi:hypothetical protein